LLVFLKSSDEVMTREASIQTVVFDGTRVGPTVLQQSETAWIGVVQQVIKEVAQEAVFHKCGKAVGFFSTPARSIQDGFLGSSQTKSKRKS
jgi:hypothetical protein